MKDQPWRSLAGARTGSVDGADGHDRSNEDGPTSSPYLSHGADLLGTRAIRRRRPSIPHRGTLPRFTLSLDHSGPQRGSRATRCTQRHCPGLHR